MITANNGKDDYDFIDRITGRKITINREKKPRRDYLKSFRAIKKIKLIRKIHLVEYCETN